VLSQLTAAVAGRGWLYDVTIGSVLAVLSLSANTSFVGFPRLCRQVAHDGFLPKVFALAGRRLVYTAGILFLAGGAGLLLLAFGGITDRLIPLFAVGAFLSFTLSQAGMAQHWRRAGPGRENRLWLGINGAGALATGVALAIILVAKFVEGAWITVVVIPATLGMLRLVRRYYDDLDRLLLADESARMDFGEHAPPLVVIPMGRWDSISGEPARAAGLTEPRLLVEISSYRSVLGPLLRTIAELRRVQPGRAVAVVLPQLVLGHWWETLLHTRRERKLRKMLLRHGGAEIAVVGVPWQLTTPTSSTLPSEEPDGG